MPEISDPQERVRYLEKQAAIAAGCDYLIKLCPSKVVALGRQAQSMGYSGSSSALFWVAFAVKWLAIGGAAGTGVVIAATFWIRRGRPEAAEVAKAKLLVACAETKTKQAKVRSRQGEAAFNARKKLMDDMLAHLAAAKKEVDDLRQELNDGKRELVAMQKKLDDYRAAMTAMRAFRPGDGNSGPRNKLFG